MLRSILLLNVLLSLIICSVLTAPIIDINPDVNNRENGRHDHRPYGPAQNPMHVPFITNRPSYGHAPLENPPHHPESHQKPQQYEHHRGFFGSIWHLITLPGRWTWKAVSFPVRFTWRIVSSVLNL
uniref:Uncharacterized protein n=1 Tax=Strigamia maritima TaxID=126957 RepID=T1IV33_STRMM